MSAHQSAGRRDPRDHGARSPPRMTPRTVLLDALGAALRRESASA